MKFAGVFLSSSEPTFPIKDDIDQFCDFLVDSNCRLPQLNAVVIPDHVDDGVVRSKLLNDFNLEIGAGLGDLAGRVWRIGLMGYASNPKNIEYCLSALKSVL